MLIWIAIYALVGCVGSLGELRSKPDLSVFQPATKLSKTVNIASMKNRVETLLNGTPEIKSKPSSTFKGVKMGERSVGREQLESMENVDVVKDIQRRRRSIEETTERANLTEKQKNFSDTSTAESPTTTMSYIMRIAPRDRRSNTLTEKVETQETTSDMSTKLDSFSSEKAATKDPETKTEQFSETTIEQSSDETSRLSSEVTSKKISETASKQPSEVTSKQFVETTSKQSLETKSKQSSEVTSKQFSETTSKQSSEVTSKQFLDTTTKQSLEAKSMQSSDTTPASSDGYSSKNPERHYTFPPGFFRHRNFLQEATTDEENEETKSQKSKASHESNTQEALKGDTTRGDATKHLGRKDLRADVNTVDTSIHDHGQEQPQEAATKQINLATDSTHSLGAKVVPSFVVTSLAALVVSEAV